MNDFMGILLSMYIAQSYFEKEIAKQSKKPKKPNKPKKEKTEKVMSVDKQIDEAVRLGVLTEKEANELRGSKKELKTMTLNEVREQIEDAFIEYGSYICICRDKEETWEEALKQNGFSEEVLPALLKEISTDSESTDAEIDTELFADNLCGLFGFALEFYESTKVFDSPGSNIFVLSFVLSSGAGEDFKTYSFNNIHERC